MTPAIMLKLKRNAMARKDEKGFGIVEIVMVAVIVILLGAVVYLGIQTTQKKDSATASPPPSASVAPSATPSAASANEAADALAHVKAFYQKYLADASSMNGLSYKSDQWA